MTLRSLISLKRIISIEVLIQEDADLQFNIVEVQIKGKKIKIYPIESSDINLENIGTIVAKEIPLSLTLSGKGVILKEVHKDANGDLETSIRRSLRINQIQDFA